MIDLQTQTNTLIQVSPKPIYITGLQSRVISISGDQMNVNYAAAVIENTVTIEQFNQQAGVLQAPLCRPYEDSGTSYANQSGKSNGVVLENSGEFSSTVEGSASTNVSRPAQASHPSSKQPAF